MHYDGPFSWRLWGAIVLEACIIIGTFVVAGFVHSTAGFGSALLAVPIITIVIGVRTAVPLEAVVGLVLTAAILYRHRHAW